MAKKAPKKPAGTDLWGEDHLLEAPRTDLENRRRIGRRARIARVGVWTALIVAPLSVLTNVGMIGTLLNAGGGDDTVQAQTVELQGNPGQGEAQLAVQEWIAAQVDEGGIPGASLIGWSSSASIPAMTDETTEAYGHTFAVATDSMGVLEVTQVVFRDRASGAVTASTEEPSIAFTDKDLTVAAPAETWAGYGAPSSDKGVQSSVDAWAASLTSGSSDNVRVSVRDGNADHLYPVLDGVQSVKTEIISIGQKPTTREMSDKDVQEIRSQAIARVRVSVVWDEDDSVQQSPAAPTAGAASDGGGEDPAAPAPADAPALGSADAKGTTFVMDLRLTGMDSGAPVVTAWGPTGSGPALTDFQNAYTESSSN
ncbi:hypothetical protein Bequi_09800 [Brachybacterium sp. JHP9]|uniref:Uncharacterized protein n=1 Tax=Brachybacterium equifaecis TaxID=2910770 RepID=A0ABT0R179_9MICO|nr:hypothetical protein [Brachybacterium equifaecis]MCL6423676.1 hypothetical protein [Brachybacterium equifaecis]